MVFDEAILRFLAAADRSPREQSSVHHFLHHHGDPISQETCRTAYSQLQRSETGLNAAVIPSRKRRPARRSIGEGGSRFRNEE